MSKLTPVQKDLKVLSGLEREFKQIDSQLNKNEKQQNALFKSHKVLDKQKNVLHKQTMPVLKRLAKAGRKL